MWETDTSQPIKSGGPRNTDPSAGGVREASPRPLRARLPIFRQPARLALNGPDSSAAARDRRRSWPVADAQAITGPNRD
jgi:hypothetical protein